MSPGTDGPAHYDVVIIGGAFAGAATALQILRSAPGRRVLIVERQERFGRKVGEATVEVSGMFLTRVLGLYDILSRDHLPKHGLRFWFADGPGRTLPEMTEVGARNVAGLPSFQLDRSLLDESVLEIAAAEGAALRRPARVASVDLDWPAHRIRIETDGGEEEITARWVIDASGRQAMLSRKLGHHRKVEEHPTAAVWARWRGVADMDGAKVLGTDPLRPRLPRVHSARRLATNHFCGYGWWCWVIPLAGGETSIGVVHDKRLFRWPTEGKLRDQYVHFVRTQVSGLEELLEDAEIDADDFLAYESLPYRSTQMAGRGWCLVGDAAGFMDPYYSPGLDWVSITTFTAARLAADDLRGNLSERALDDRIEQLNARFVRTYDRWIGALYLDKYEILGDAELASASFLFETGMYYLGVVGPVWRDLSTLENGVFGLDIPQARLAYKLMRFFKGRMIRLARFRRRTGHYGRRNLGWKFYVPSFGLNGRALRLALTGAAVWARAEGHYLFHRLRHGKVNVSVPVDVAEGAPRA